MEPQELHTLVLDVLADHMEWLLDQLSTWPFMCCFDTCNTLIYDDRLTSHLIMKKGKFVPDGEEWSFGTGHCWLTGRRGTSKGWIYDPTIRQFQSSTTDVGLFPPGTPLFKTKR